MPLRSAPDRQGWALAPDQAEGVAWGRSVRGFGVRFGGPPLGTRTVQGGGFRFSSRRPRARRPRWADAPRGRGR